MHSLTREPGQRVSRLDFVPGPPHVRDAPDRPNVESSSRLTLPAMRLYQVDVRVRGSDPKLAEYLDAWTRLHSPPDTYDLVSDGAYIRHRARAETEQEATRDTVDQVQKRFPGFQVLHEKTKPVED